MMGGFLTALKVEIFVASRSLAPRLILIVPALVVAAQLLLTKLNETGQQAREALLGDSGPVSNNAYGYYVDGLVVGLTLLSLTLVAYAASSFAGERDSGVIRHLVMRRVSRQAVVLAKLVYFHILATCAVLVILGVVTLIAGWLWEFGPVVEDGFELIGTEEIRAEIQLGLTLALIPLPAAIAFGLLISVAAQSATQAITSALGITLALDLFKGAMGDAANYIYVTFQPSLIDESYLQDVSRLVRGYSDILVDERILLLNQWVPWPEMILFVVLALALVQRRKL